MCHFKIVYTNKWTMKYKMFNKQTNELDLFGSVESR